MFIDTAWKDANRSQRFWKTIRWATFAGIAATSYYFNRSFLYALIRIIGINFFWIGLYLVVLERGQEHSRKLVAVIFSFVAVILCLGIASFLMYLSLDPSFSIFP